MGKLWLKLWTETIHDRKLTRVNPAWRWAWIGLLALAAEADDEGKIELAPGVPLPEEDIEAEIAIGADEWQAAKAYFLSLGMLRLDGDTFVVCKYVDRQKSNDPTNAVRQKRHRDKNNAAVTNDSNALRNALRAPLLSRVEVEVEVEEEYISRAVVVDLDELAVGTKVPEKVRRTFEAGIGMIASPLMEESLVKLVREYGEEVVAEALTYTAEQAKRPSMAYAKKVLASWKAEGRGPSPNGPKPLAAAIVLPPLPEGEYRL